MANYPFIKIFVHPGSKHKDFANNELLATRNFDYGFLELVFWHGLFEVFYRPSSKRYGYFVISFFELKQGLDFVKLPSVDLSKYLPGVLNYSPINFKDQYANAFPFFRKK